MPVGQTCRLTCFPTVCFDLLRAIGRHNSGIQAMVWRFGLDHDWRIADSELFNGLSGATTDRAFAQTLLWLLDNGDNKASKANGQEVSILDISLAIVLWISSVTRKVPTRVCANVAAGTGAGCIGHSIPTR